MLGRRALCCLILGAAVCDISCASAPQSAQLNSPRPDDRALAETSPPTLRDKSDDESAKPRATSDEGVIRQTSAEEPAEPPKAGVAAGSDDRAPYDSPEHVEPRISAAAEALLLEAAPVETTDHPLPISLATALRLSDARPLVVAAAQASAWVAEAQLQRAQVLWVPQFQLGFDYYRHDGFGPDFNRGVNHSDFGAPGGGGPLNQNLNYFYGFGTFYMSVNVTDIIFEPLQARQVLDSRRLDIQSAKNDALLAAAKAYFDVHEARGRYAGTRDVVDRGGKLVERIVHLSEDLVPRIEVHRARRMLATMEQKAVSAREQWRVSSTNLTQVLRLDPSAVVVPVEHDHLQVTLIDPARPLDELISIGVAHRPEIGSQKAQVQAAEARVRREKGRPFLPLILITGFQTPVTMNGQFGFFGTGFDRRMDLWSLRDDVSLGLYWQLEGMGFGNLARIKQQRGEESDAMVKLFRTQDTVAAEVTAAQAKVQAAAVRVLEADRSLKEAIVTYDGNYEGLAQTVRFENVLHQVYRPQEAVKSLERLMESYDQYFTTVADYNRAQFELFHALGYPAAEVANFQPPGETVPVDTDRPFGLPAVGEGPPPANR